MADEKEGTPERKGKGKSTLLWLLIVLVVLVGAGGAALVFTGRLGTPSTNIAQPGAPGSPPPAPVNAEARYLSLDPPFVLNYEDQGEMRFVQLSVAAMARSDKTLEAVEAHLPRIRNSLILLFGSQDFQSLSTVDGKEALREAALGAVRDILRTEARVPEVEAVYFTNFVMQ